MAHSIPRRTVLAALAGALPLAGLPALASTWPQRPVRLMVGAPPGGPYFVPRSASSESKSW